MSNVRREFCLRKGAEDCRVGIIDYIRRIAMMSEEIKTYDYVV